MLASDLANSQIALGYFFVGKQTGERSSMLRKRTPAWSAKPFCLSEPRETRQDNSGDPHRIMFRLQDGNTSHDELFPLARGVSADHSNAEHA